MGRRRAVGLTRRGGTWYIEKRIKGYGRLYESTRTRSLEDAEAYLEKRVAEIRRGLLQGTQPHRTFAEAAGKYLDEKVDASSLEDLLWHTDWLVSRIGDMTLIAINRTVTDRLLERRKAEGVSPASVNRTMEVLRAILLKARDEWQWIGAVPRVRMLEEPKRRVRWLTRGEADALLAELPPHLRAMARFTLATGLREQNVCGLEWSQVDLERRVAWIHPDQAKNARALSVPLNNDAVVVLRGEQGKHPRWVFTYQGERVTRCNNHAWRKALKRAGIEDFRWHDLRHTWASWHVMAGTPLQVLMELGGWSSYEMVQRYAHLSAAHLTAYAERLSMPRVVCEEPKGAEV